MKLNPVLEQYFYHEGRGPELQNVRWKNNGVVLFGFEYYNPDDTYSAENLKHIILNKVQTFSMASDEVHGCIVANRDTNAAIHEILDSDWLASFNQAHMSNSKHYQIMFYDEIYDVVCESIKFGLGKIEA
ncbi:hypothetical protein [Shewanella gelidii]|uniref:Uncharacterized protein n=1 Tax=Shewanella gelidii TaxID=1642821 RepID=A0A917K1H7_9GAMM|nr:hypothetical protein [Shewanella gelidii]MCL1098545.1 hypothetical protein [Shewanella gelidii]GGI93485.1 hypothetical protein GCM10009332_33410 [Shewanella gelidii]